MPDYRRPKIAGRSFFFTIDIGEARNASRQKRGEAAIWQPRFWEHALRNEADLERHLDTIHYNPVKPGLVARGADWLWSSFPDMGRCDFMSQIREWE
jgi:putative transposase